MNGCKRIVSIALAVQIIIGFSVVGCKASMDTAYWENSTMYTLLDEGEKSNCDVTFLIAKVFYDYPAHRIHILFMMSMKSFNDVNLSGVQMNFNNLGKVRLRADGNNEYDNRIYYAELEHMEDSVTKTLYFETVVGIKQGIPNNLAMSVIITDTNGANSNTFDVDITPEQIAESTTTQRRKKTTTKKSSTTKRKTVKKSVKKTKTSTQAKKEEQSNNLTAGTLEAVQIVDTEINSNNDDKKKVVVLVSSLLSVAIACTCTIAIRKKRG